MALLLFVRCRPPFSLCYCCDGSVGVPLILGRAFTKREDEYNNLGHFVDGLRLFRVHQLADLVRGGSASSPSSDDTVVVATALFPED